MKYRIKITQYILFTIILSCIFSLNSLIYTNSSIHTSIDDEIPLNLIIPEKDFRNQLFRSTSNAEFRVIVKISPSLTNHQLNYYGADVEYFNSFPGVALTVTKANLFHLIQQKYIREIWNNSIINGMDSYEELILNQSRLICDFNEKIDTNSLWIKDLYGNGIKVAILDTGIDIYNPALNQTKSQIDRITVRWNFLDKNENILDDNGHGSEVAGIIGSNGLFGYIQGVAPNCSFLIGKILDYNAEGTVETLIQGIDWALENEADVINLSLGKVVSNLTSPEVEAVNYAVDNGVIVCVAAGNARGREEFGFNDMYTILSPGIAPKAITVGAIDNNNILYEYSSGGPVARNYNDQDTDYLYDSISPSFTWLKPDVVAPGVLLNTTSGNGKSTNVVTGTSYATAVTTGLCVLLRQQFLEAHPSLIKASIIKNSNQIVVNTISPFSENLSSIVSPFFQGMGLINPVAAYNYLNNYPDFIVEDSIVSQIVDYLFLNSQTSFKIQLYVHKQIDNFQISISENLADIVFVSYLPSSLNAGQYDLGILINTEKAHTGYYQGTVTLQSSNNFETVSIKFYVVKAYGRVLFDYRSEGISTYYSLNGNLRNLISVSKKFGLIPFINSHDLQYSSLSSLNLNSYEVLTLINPKNTTFYPFTQKAVDSVLDYLSPGGEYSGGALIFLPSQNSDFDLINSILEGTNTNYENDLSFNISFDVSSSFNILLNDPNPLTNLYLPYPLQINVTNPNFNAYLDKFVYGNDHYINGSILIGGNTIDMFLDSPYLYYPPIFDYTDLTLSNLYGDNHLLLENILGSSVVRSINFTYSLLDHEIEPEENLTVVIQSSNSYKTMPNWDFYLSITDDYGTEYIVNSYESDSNGTSVFNFKITDIGISAGEYTLQIHSFTGTKSWAIYIIAPVSVGGIIITVSLILCIVFLLLIRKKPKL